MGHPALLIGPGPPAFKNDEMTRQYFLVHVTYNQELPPDFWSVEAADRRIKK